MTATPDPNAITEPAQHRSLGPAAIHAQASEDIPAVDDAHGNWSMSMLMCALHRASVAADWRVTTLQARSQRTVHSRLVSDKDPETVLHIFVDDNGIRYVPRAVCPSALAGAAAGRLGRIKRALTREFGKPLRCH